MSEDRLKCSFAFPRQGADVATMLFLLVFAQNYQNYPFQYEVY